MTSKKALLRDFNNEEQTSTPREISSSCKINLLLKIRTIILNKEKTMDSINFILYNQHIYTCRFNIKKIDLMVIRVPIRSKSNLRHLPHLRKILISIIHLNLAKEPLTWITIKLL
jgi:hypothetical protein